MIGRSSECDIVCDHSAVSRVHAQICVDGKNVEVTKRTENGFLFVNGKACQLMSSMWPGPHTFILPMNDDFHSIALKDNHTVAVRITAFETLANLCKESGVPLVSTSANISGHEATSEISLLDKKLLDRVQLVLDLPCGGQNAPTSIYDTLTHTLVRKGPGWKE